MTTIRQFLAAGLALFCLTAGSFAAYLETEPAAATRDRPAVVVPVAPRPAPQHPLRQLVRSLRVGAPTHYRGLTIFPLLTSQRSSLDIRTLDQALAHGWIDIRERKDASVGEIIVRNKSRHAIFLMAGEIVLGGKQNRIIRQDVLLGAHSGAIAVPVYCGEKDRWDKPQPLFKSGHSMAEPRLRAMAAQSSPQAAIWNSIDSRMADAEIQSKTRNYQELYEHRDTKRKLDKSVARFRHCCGGDTVGLVAVSGNRIIGCDLFSDPTLLSSLWSKICRSYAIDSLGHRSKAAEHRLRRPGINARHIRHFLDGVGRARLEAESTPGSGTATRISGNVQGQTLSWHGETVHAALFPAITLFRDDLEPIHR